MTKTTKSTDAKTQSPAPTTVKGSGTRGSPWTLQTPSLSSEFVAFRDAALDPPALVVQVGKTELRYQLRCIEDLHKMLKAHGDWMLLGNADEQKPVADATVEAWGRSPHNPVGGWYGMASRRGCADASATMCRPSWKYSALPRWSTMPRTIACAPNNPPPCTH